MDVDGSYHYSYYSWMGICTNLQLKGGHIVWTPMLDMKRTWDWQPQGLIPCFGTHQTLDLRAHLLWDPSAIASFASQNEDSVQYSHVFSGKSTHGSVEWETPWTSTPTSSTWKIVETPWNSTLSNGRFSSHGAKAPRPRNIDGWIIPSTKVSEGVLKSSIPRWYLYLYHIECSYMFLNQNDITYIYIICVHIHTWIYIYSYID